MALKAYFFSRAGGAIIAGEAEGHAAFGFETGEQGKVLVGGVELATGKTSHIDDAMCFWTDTTSDALKFMASQVRYGPHTRYDMAKCEVVDSPNPVAALEEVDKIRLRDYSLLSQNCLTDTIQVLTAFGVADLPGGGRPAAVFKAVHAPIIPLLEPWPDWILDASIYEFRDQFGIRTDIFLTTPGSPLNNPTADQRDDSGDLPTPSIGSFLLRRGAMAIYPEHDFKGEPCMLPVGRVFNFDETSWPDKTIRSWIASPYAFDPASVIVEPPPV